MISVGLHENGLLHLVQQNAMREFVAVRCKWAFAVRLGEPRGGGAFYRGLECRGGGALPSSCDRVQA